MTTLEKAKTLQAGTVFLKITFSVPGNSKKVTGADVLTTDADKRFIRISKQLLNSPQLDAIKRMDFQTRAYVWNVCHKFADGVSLLPLHLVEDVDAKLTAYKAERAAMVKDFMGTYQQLCKDAAEHLKGMYNPGDYPSPDRMEDAFSFSWEIFCFDVPQQLQGLNTVLYQKAKEQLAETMKDAAAKVEAAMLKECKELVDHLHEKLTPGDDGKPRILKDVAVNNLREFMELFPKKNVTNQAELAAVIAELENLLNGVTGDKLRNSDLLRDKIKSNMDGVKAKLSALVVEKPGRVFRDE